MKLEEKTLDALRWIITILDKYKIKYQVSGGLAAKIYGSKRKLADIDINIQDKDFSKIINEVKGYSLFGPKKFNDENWNLKLLTLNYKGQEIDMCGRAKIFDKNTNEWVDVWVNFSNNYYYTISGIKISVTPINDLVSYKSKLLREVDILDIKQLDLSFNIIH